MMTTHGDEVFTLADGGRAVTGVKDKSVKYDVLCVPDGVKTVRSDAYLSVSRTAIWTFSLSLKKSRTIWVT